MFAGGPVFWCSVEIKRILVLLLAAALLVIAICSITFCGGDVLCVILYILVAIGAIGGFVGAWWMSPRHLAWFFWTLCLLIVIQIAFIMFNFLHYTADRDVAVHNTIWSFVTLGILVVGLILTYDLRRSSGGGAAAPLLGPALV